MSKVFSLKNFTIVTTTVFVIGVVWLFANSEGVLRYGKMMCIKGGGWPGGVWSEECWRSEGDAFMMASLSFLVLVVIGLYSLLKTSKRKFMLNKKHNRIKN